MAASSSDSPERLAKGVELDNVDLNEAEATLVPLLDLEQERKEHKRNSVACYAAAGTISVLLITLICVCIGLPIARLGKNVSGVHRVHYIQAEFINWTYVPSGINQCNADGTGGPGPGPGEDTPLATVAGTFRKAHFRAYTDENFETPMPEDPKWAHLGILGPVIYAEAGDTIDIVFRNNVDFPLNLEPAGNQWGLAGLLPAVTPTRIVIYTWDVPEDAGPSPADEQNSRLYLYRSTLSVPRHENAGLAGPLIITRKGEANPDGTTRGVDRDLISHFEVWNENETPYNTLNLADASINETELFRKVINGYSWCSVPGMEVNYGEKVRWHISAMGSEEGLHNFHWHGNVLRRAGRVADQFHAVPGSTISADLITDNPGTWMLHCHVNEHLDAGMVSLYTVLPPPAGAPPALILLPYQERLAQLGGIERQYYIASDEIEWDYAPLGGDACGPAFENGNATIDAVAPFEEGDVMAAAGNGTLSLGPKVTKAVFREYEDAAFTKLKQRPASDSYLGLVGPVLRARVGDTLVVTLRNNARFKTTLHPHGVLYTKAGEGAPYTDGTKGDDKKDDGVLQGEEWTYVWHVPERAGPGEQDSSSHMWMYHSHSDETLDTFAGLFGAIIIYPRSENPNAPLTVPADVDREVVLFFSNMEESASLYTTVNAESLLADEIASRDMSIEDVLADDGFIADNQRSSVNGYMFCNMPGLQFDAGSKVRFHMMGLGAQLDMHSPLIDGASSYFLNANHHTSKVQMSAGIMLSRDMFVAQKGLWRIQCGVQEHLSMRATYEVVAGSVPLTITRDGNERVWYIAAHDIAWDYAPGYNGSVPMCTLVDFSAGASTYLTQDPGKTVGHVSLKAHYVAYTDATFTTLVPQPEWHGLQGPLLAAEVGDILKVVFKNMLPSRTVNLRPIAPFLALTPGGSVEAAQGSPAFAVAVEPGQTVTYSWYIPEMAGPGSEDSSTLSWTYTSSVDAMADENLGLVGGLFIGCKGCLNWSDPFHPLPTAVDRIEPVLWQVFDENLNPYLEANMVAAGIDVEKTDLADPDFMESNMRHSINGWMFCTMPHIQLEHGQTVRWVMIDFGGATALHSPYFQSNILHTADGPAPTDLMMPGQAVSVDMVADKLGTWPMYCQVHDHLEAGMMGTFNVVKAEGSGSVHRRLLRQ